jgi:hypothetical protein
MEYDNSPTPIEGAFMLPHLYQNHRLTILERKMI